jgi:arylsulfatase A-like enzyme
MYNKRKLLTSSAILIAITSLIVPHVEAAQAQITSTVRSKAKMQTAASRGLPNILLIMTDDVGFGASSTFGGLIETPAFDKLAANGLRYNNFHVTPLCSPSRAALLTGRNPHAVGMGNLTDIPSSDAGYTAEVPKSAATVARVLSDNGYHTAVFGKYHLIPKWELTRVGSRDHWPTSMGFDYFYGFESSFTDQFTPNLIENTSFVKPPYDPGYHLERDLADKAIGWLQDVRVSGGDQPFFLYYASPSAHAPVQAPKEWIDKYRGRFDQGWDAAREDIIARQKKMGIVPRNAILTERTDEIPAWGSLSADQKKLYARYMEVYAGALSYADNQIGRILDDLEANGQLDNTMVIYIQGDNGPSIEGGPSGLVNYYNRFNGIPEKIEFALDRIDKLGGPTTAPAIPIGWSNVLSTPFQYWKGRADYLGGVRTGLVISWPKGVESKGQLRPQFHSIQDIVPTIYDVVGVTPPDQVDGVHQQPITGISMVNTLGSAAQPSRRHEQYFEIPGNMSIYKDGWWANYSLAQGETLTSDLDSKLEWELYDLTKDFSQSRDIAGGSPAKLKELKGSFSAQASQNNVFPITRTHPRGRKPVTDQPGRYVFYEGTERYSDWGFPNVKRRSWSVSADIKVPTVGGTGVVVNQGGRFAGWGLVFLSGVPKFIYKYSDSDEGQIILDPGAKLGPGNHMIEIQATQESEKDAASRSRERLSVNGSVSFVMKINQETVASGTISDSAATYFQIQGASIGHSTGSALIEGYEGEFKFNGDIQDVVIDVMPN